MSLSVTNSVATLLKDWLGEAIIEDNEGKSPPTALRFMVVSMFTVRKADVAKWMNVDAIDARFFRWAGYQIIAQAGRQPIVPFWKRFSRIEMKWQTVSSEWSFIQSRKKGKPSIQRVSLLRHADIRKILHLDLSIPEVIVSLIDEFRGEPDHVTLPAPFLVISWEIPDGKTWIPQPIFYRHTEMWNHVQATCALELMNSFFEIWEINREMKVVIPGTFSNFKFGLRQDEFKACPVHDPQNQAASVGHLVDIIIDEKVIPTYCLPTTLDQILISEKIQMKRIRKGNLPTALFFCKEDTHWL